MTKMNDIEKIKIALGEPLKKVIGGQEFEFYPLSVDSLPELTDIQSRTEKNPESILEKDNMTRLVELMLKFLRDNIPNFKDEDELTLKRFLMKHFVEIQMVFKELNQPSEETKVNVEEMKKKFLEQNPHLQKNPVP